MENIYVQKCTLWNVCLSIIVVKMSTQFLIHHLLLVFDSVFVVLLTYCVVWCMLYMLKDHSLVSIAEKLCVLQPPIQWIFYILENRITIKGWGMKIKLCLPGKSAAQQQKGPYLYIKHSEVKEYSLSEDVCSRMKEKYWKRKNDYQIVICDKCIKLKKNILKKMMELLKLMMCKNDFLLNGSIKMDERVPPINLDNFPDFLLCMLACWYFSFLVNFGEFSKCRRYFYILYIFVDFADGF